MQKYIKSNGGICSKLWNKLHKICGWKLHVGNILLMVFRIQLNWPYRKVKSDLSAFRRPCFNEKVRIVFGRSIEHDSLQMPGLLTSSWCLLFVMLTGQYKVFLFYILYFHFHFLFWFSRKSDYEDDKELVKLWLVASEKVKYNQILNPVLETI